MADASRTELERYEKAERRTTRVARWLLLLGILISLGVAVHLGWQHLFGRFRNCNCPRLTIEHFVLLFAILLAMAAALTLLLYKAVRLTGLDAIRRNSMAVAIIGSFLVVKSVLQLLSGREPSDDTPFGVGGLVLTSRAFDLAMAGLWTIITLQQWLVALGVTKPPRLKWWNRDAAGKPSGTGHMPSQ